MLAGVVRFDVLEEISSMLSKELCARLQIADIGINLVDPMFDGKYNGKFRHKEDRGKVLERACLVGVKSFLLTSGSLTESMHSIELCNKFVLKSSPNAQCFCTVGCHPTRCSEFVMGPEKYYEELNELVSLHSVHGGGCVASIGEIGLDFDRLHFCGEELQEQFFERQLQLAVDHRLPLFLHDRNSRGRFLAILEPFISRLAGGVVHSFTGSEEELTNYLRLGLYIGVNGCSIKTEENLRVVKLIPLDRLLIETDGPWCEIKRSHASRKVLEEVYGASNISADNVLAQFPVSRKEKYLPGSVAKGRTEPCHILFVLEVLFLLHRNSVKSIQALADCIFANTLRLFPCFSAGIV